MKITVFTSNQPRHIGLVKILSPLADEMFIIQECTTAFPGKVDDFYRRSEVMQRYFARVIAAELSVFGDVGFLPENCRSLSLRMGDLSLLDIDRLNDALAADIFIVFGSSWVKGPLVEALIDRGAINLHMGLSPWYRGTACNFWACHDRRFEMVGGTIHLLSKGLDSGSIIRRAIPPLVEATAFDLGMLAVKETHVALTEMIRDGSIGRYVAQPQDKSLQLRYSRNAEFTDEVADNYLKNLPSASEIFAYRQSTKTPNI